MTADLVDVTLGDLGEADVARVHDRLLAPTFRPDELLTLHELRRDFTGPAAQPSAVVLADAEPVAVMLGGWFVDHRVLLLTYLAVDPAARGLGLGSRLLRDVLGRWAAQQPGALVLAEVDDPRHWPADGVQGDPVARLRFYGRNGARLVPFPYAQPALRPGARRVDGMLLLRLDRTPGVPGDVLARFLVENAAASDGEEAPPPDPALARAVERARGLDLDAGLLPVERWAEVRAG